jgi:hypothetical protein
MTEYNVREVSNNRVHTVYLENDKLLIVEIDNIIYRAELTSENIIREPEGFISDEYLIDYFKSLLKREMRIKYTRGMYIISWHSVDKHFILELELNNPKELYLLEQIKELKRQLRHV